MSKSTRSSSDHTESGDNQTERFKMSQGQAAAWQERQRMIAEAAYFRAQQRGFDGGNPEEDWFAAEREIDEQQPQAS
jgi:hypothetical protein